MPYEIPVISPEIQRIIDNTPSWPAMTCANEEAKPMSIDDLRQISEELEKDSVYRKVTDGLEFSYNGFHLTGVRLSRELHEDIVNKCWFEMKPIANKPIYPYPHQKENDEAIKEIEEEIKNL